MIIWFEESYFFNGGQLSSSTIVSRNLSKSETVIESAPWFLDPDFISGLKGISLTKSVAGCGFLQASATQ